MQLTGHLTRSVFERYNIVSEGDLLTAARMLDNFTDAARGFDTTLKTTSLNRRAEHKREHKAPAGP